MASPLSHMDCPICGVSADSEFFDDTRGVLPVPPAGQSIVLAEFQLPPQYCGLLENFAQFTNAHAIVNQHIKTPGLEWVLRRNGQPLHPYTGMNMVLNPWGFNNYTVAIRLDEGSKLEFVLRNLGQNRRAESSGGGVEDVRLRCDGPVDYVAGRISGRYWFNRIYGNTGDDVCEGRGGEGHPVGSW